MKIIMEMIIMIIRVMMIIQWLAPSLPCGVGIIDHRRQLSPKQLLATPHGVSIFHHFLANFPPAVWGNFLDNQIDKRGNNRSSKTAESPKQLLVPYNRERFSRVFYWIKFRKKCPKRSQFGNNLSFIVGRRIPRLVWNIQLTGGDS